MAARVMDGPAELSAWPMRSGSGWEASVVSRVLARINILSTPTASTRNGMTCSASSHSSRACSALITLFHGAN